MTKKELIELILEDDELSMESDPKECRAWLLDALRHGGKGYEGMTKSELEIIALGRDIIN